MAGGIVKQGSISERYKVLIVYNDQVLEAYDSVVTIVNVVTVLYTQHFA